MKSAIVLMCLWFWPLLTPLISYSQGKEPVSIEKAEKQLVQVNGVVSKKIKRANKKIRKRLAKAFPAPGEAHLDSLTRLGIDSVQWKELPAELQELRQSITQTLGKTPPQLEMAEELQGTLAQLDQLEQLYQEFQLIQPNGDFGSLPEFQKPELPELERLVAVNELDKLKSALNEYQDQFGGWEDELLARVMDLEEVRLIQAQKAKLASFKPLPDMDDKAVAELQTNDFVKEQLGQKAEEIKRMGEQALQEKLDEAQNQLSNFKDRFPALPSIEKAPRRPQNPYADRPHWKRLRLGGSVQWNRVTGNSVDVALRLAYVMNPKMRLGLAVSDRVMLESDRSQPGSATQAARGIQVYFDYTVIKHFYLEALYETVRVGVPGTTDSGKQWVEGGMLGLGKRFQIGKNLKGNLVLLYNFFHGQHSPQPSPWVLRLGFEL